MNKRASIAILGGGIIGLTVGTLLQLNGFATQIYTELDPLDQAANRRALPSLASIHAAASILPHSVSAPLATRWTAASQDCFGALSHVEAAHVRKQRHFEIFEEAHKASPDYHSALSEFRYLENDDIVPGLAPRRHDCEVASGWTFEMYFAESLKYLSFLHRYYLSLGGRYMANATLSLDRCIRGRYRVMINCTGQAGGHTSSGVDSNPLVVDKPEGEKYQTLSDSAAGVYVRGHYLKVALGKMLTTEGKVQSYNYTPAAQVYHGATGQPADVYCYPRSDSWLLGGSRETFQGSLDAASAWAEEATPVTEYETYLTVAGRELAIPKAILEVNSELIAGLTNGEITLSGYRRSNAAAFEAGVGLRFLRNDDRGSVRLCTSRFTYNDSLLYMIHNYGHGGSGFTLSWGCAFQVLAEIRKVYEDEGVPTPSHGYSVNDVRTSGPTALLKSVIQNLIDETDGPASPPTS